MHLYYQVMSRNYVIAEVVPDFQSIYVEIVELIENKENFFIPARSLPALQWLRDCALVVRVQKHDLSGCANAGHFSGMAKTSGMGMQDEGGRQKKAWHQGHANCREKCSKSAEGVLNLAHHLFRRGGQACEDEASGAERG